MGGHNSSNTSTQENTNTNNINNIKNTKNINSSRVISIEEEKELDKQFAKLKESKIIPIAKLSYINNNKSEWLIVFLGTECTPYENGYFKLKLVFKDVFPKHGPEALFITQMFHPNIASNGHVCMDLLNYWNEKTNIEDIMFGIINLLDNPVAQGGYDNEAKKQLEKDYDKYIETVEDYTVKYAMKSF